MSVNTNRSFIEDMGFVSSIRYSLDYEPDRELVLVKPEFRKKDLNGMGISGLDHAIRVFNEGTNTIIILISDLPKEHFIFSKEDERVEIMIESDRVGYIEGPTSLKQVTDLYKKLV